MQNEPGIAPGSFALGSAKGVDGSHHKVTGRFHTPTVAQTRLTFYNMQRKLSLKNCSQQTVSASDSGED